MRKKTETESNSKDNKDTLLDSLAMELNKGNKDGGKIAYSLEEQDDPSSITDWVSTGSSILDLAISNRPNGGLPVGRISELTGLEGCVTEDTLVKVCIEGRYISYESSQKDETGNRIVKTEPIHDPAFEEIMISDVKFLLNPPDPVGERKSELPNGLLNIKNPLKNKVSVLTSVNGEKRYVEITNYVEKGILKTYEVVLSPKINGVTTQESDKEYSIKVSKEHKFFTNQGWVELQDLKITEHTIYCEDGQYHDIVSIKYIGKHKIVDITVDSEEHSYFGNGMLNHNTGKSLISAHIVADTQRKGGKAIFIDTENSAAPEFWKSLGVDLSKDKLLYVQADTVESIFEIIEKSIAHIRKDNPDLLLTIIVDSVAGASTKVELESDHGKDGFSTGKAIIISKAMRKITNMIGRQKVLIVFTNQLRQNLNAGPFGEKWVVSGGKGLSYHCSVRVRLNNKGKLKKGDAVIGNICKAVVIKNRMGPPQKIAEFDILFDSGISDYSSWLKVLKSYNLIKQSGAYYKYTTSNGEEIQFQGKEFGNLLDGKPEFKTEVYNKMCAEIITKYKDANAIIDDDDVTIADEDGNDISDSLTSDDE